MQFPRLWRYRFGETYHYFGWNILSLSEVNELFCTEPFAEIPLFVTAVNGNDSHPLYRWR